MDWFVKLIVFLLVGLPGCVTYTVSFADIRSPILTSEQLDNRGELR